MIPLLFLITLTTTATTSCGAAFEPFALAEMANGGRGDGISFDRSWIHGIAAEQVEKLNFDHLPKQLGVPDYVRVYEKKGTSRCSLAELARAARGIVDKELSLHGAILFRNLPMESAHDFKEFWRACCEIDGGEGRCWKPVTYVPFRSKRARLQGVDLATNIPAQYALATHNEMVYNPRPPSRISFYCLQPASKGGETLLAKNEHVTDSIRDATIKLVKKGGLLYMRRYPDAKHKLNDAELAAWPSWQEKCETNDRGEAVKFFTDLGFKRDDIRFDKHGTMTVRFEHSGSLRDRASGRDLWFNILSTGIPKQMDGSDYPWEIIAQAQIDEWGPVCALKLQKGDWLVLDNLRIQHGRLPYTNDPNDDPRTLLTVYTE